MKNIGIVLGDYIIIFFKFIIKKKEGLELSKKNICVLAWIFAIF